MKHLIKFNELKKTTYLSAADKLAELGGSHKDRAEKLRNFSKKHGEGVDIHNLHYHEFTFGEPPLHDDSYVITDCRFQKKNDDLFSCVYTVFVNEIGDKKLISVIFLTSSNEDEEDLNLGGEEDLDDYDGYYDYNVDQYGNRYVDRDGDGRHDMEEFRIEPLTEEEPKKSSKEEITKIEFVIRDFVDFDFIHDDNDSDDYFKFTTRKDAYEFKKFVLDWFKNEKTASMELEVFKNYPINKLYK